MTETVILEGWTFAQVPVWALADPALSDGAVRLLGYLVWRQGTNPNSWPSVARMAADLNVSHDTIHRNGLLLKDAGYLAISKRHGRSSLYTVIAQPEQATAIYAKLTTRKSAAGDEDTTRKSALPTTRKSALQNENHVNENQQGMNEIDAETPAPAQRTDHIFTGLRTLCRYNGDIPANTRGQLNKAAKQLRELSHPPTLQDFEDFAGWWAANDWRGKKGQSPKPLQVVEVWAQFTSADEYERRGLAASSIPVAVYQ